MENNKRTIWVNLLLSLLATPLVSLLFLIFIGIIEAIGSFITHLQEIGYWWIIPIVFGFLPSLIYFLNEQQIKINKKRNEIATSLLLYLKDRIKELKMDKLSLQDEEGIKEELLKRLEIWTWYDPKKWKKFFPDEKYPLSIFGIVDNFLNGFKNSKTKKYSDYIWKINLKSGQ